MQARSNVSLKIHKGQEIPGSAFLILNITKLMQFWNELVFSSMYLRWQREVDVLSVVLKVKQKLALYALCNTGLIAQFHE